MNPGLIMSIVSVSTPKNAPSLLIRKISGHKTEKAFLEYIKVDEELAAKEMMKYWAINW